MFRSDRSNGIIDGDSSENLRMQDLG